jgi:imidazolonepropionase-like amidohydrolase
MAGGHFYWCNQEANGVEGVRAAVRDLVRDGADHIKIMASGGGTAITDLRRPSYTVEEMRAIVDEAHNMGKLTTAHCLATGSISNALDAGVDMFEHVGFIEPDGSYKFHPELVERMAQQGTYVSPTVQTGYRGMEALLTKQEMAPLSRNDQEALDWAKAKCDSQLEFLGELWKEWNIPIISGTDAIRAFGDYCIGLELMSQAGMSNMDVIMASTSIAAKSMDVDQLVGSVEPGKDADLIVVDQDPVEDIRALRTMAMVMRAGKRIV